MGFEFDDGGVTLQYRRGGGCHLYFKAFQLIPEGFFIEG
jgi:hypothetical protein